MKQKLQRGQWWGKDQWDMLAFFYYIWIVKKHGISKYDLKCYGKDTLNDWLMNWNWRDWVKTFRNAQDLRGLVKYLVKQSEKDKEIPMYTMKQLKKWGYV